jgi:hypothetical protein
MTKNANPKPADQTPAVDDVDAPADQVDASGAGENILVALQPLPLQGAQVIYEGYEALGHGRQGLRSFPAIIELAQNPDDPESAVSLSYLYRADWHYVSSARFGTEPGSWHWQTLAAAEVAAE